MINALTDPNTVYDRYLLLTVFAFIFYHLFGIGEPTSAGWIFDLSILSTTMLSLRRFVGKITLKELFIIVFWCGLFVINFYREISLPAFNVIDVIKANRYIIYCVCILICASSFELIIVTRRKLLSFNQFSIRIIALFLAIYIIKQLLGDSRPRFFSENNFEIPILAVILSVIIEVNKDRINLKHTLYFLVGFLSLSKSGILEVLAASFARIQNISFSTITKVLIFLLLLSPLFFIIIIERMKGGLESVDRFVFLTSFIHDMSLNPMSWLIGNGNSTPISSFACNNLEYWSVVMFDGKCNSILFHSFFMRIVYDYGFLQLIFLIYTWVFALSKVFSLKIMSIIMLVLLISSLSISGFGNPIVLWGVFVVLRVARLTKINCISTPALSKKGLSVAS